MTETIEPETVLLTPELAQCWLGASAWTYDPRDEPRISALAAAMAAGDWRPGSVVLIGPEGGLRDGQHRAAAVVRSGVSITVMMFRTDEFSRPLCHPNHKILPR